MPIRPTGADALIVIDVQHDFLPGGALAVPDGDAVIAPILRLAEAFDHVILTDSGPNFSNLRMKRSCMETPFPG